MSIVVRGYWAAGVIEHFTTSWRHACSYLKAALAFRLSWCVADLTIPSSYMSDRIVANAVDGDRGVVRHLVICDASASAHLRSMVVASRPASIRLYST